MKANVASNMLIAASFALSGCGQSGFVAGKDEGKALLIPFQRLDIVLHQETASRISDSELVVSLRISDHDGASRVRRLHVGLVAEESELGLRLRIDDTDQKSVVSVTQTWGLVNADTLVYSLAEESEKDTLRLVLTEWRGHVTETYWINGTTKSFTYQRGSTSSKTVHEEYRVFYQSLGANRPLTLEDNDDGSAMALLASSAAFSEWLKSSQTSAGLRLSPRNKPACDARCVDKICAAASLCSAVKCTFGGGIANFVCDACFGTALACDIASFFL